MSLTQALQHFPLSSSVYVVYATRQQRIHIVSRSVNSLYCVVKSQLEIESELMAVDSAHLNQLFNSWTWQQGDDQKGWIGIWQHTHTLTTTELSPDLGELAEILDDVSAEMIPLRYY